MTYLPPLNGGRINASIGGNTAGAGALVSSGTLSLMGGNNITLSQNANSITISAPNAVAQTNQTLGLYGLGNTTQNSSTTLDARSISFNGLGVATVGYSNGSVQLSVPTQTNQTVGLYALGNTTQSSSGTRDARSISFNGLGGVSVGYTNGSFQISGPQTVAQTNQTVGLYGLGNTTQNSSTTLDARSLSFNGLGAATVGYSNGSIQVSVPTQTVQTQNMVSVLGSSGNISFANGNNVTFGGNASTITASASFNQTNQTVGLYALGNTTQSSSTTLDARSLSFNGLGAATVGYSNGSIQVSVPTQTVQTQNMHNLTLSGNTAGVMAQVSSGTLTLAGGNNITLSQNGNAVTISGAAGGAAGSNTLGMSNLGNTSGTTGVISGSNLQFAFAGGNNITLSQSINASSGTITISAANQSVQTQNLMTVNGTQGNVSISGGNNITVGNNASTITISAANQTNQNISLYALGNTTQNSSTLLNASNLSLNGLGAATVGYSNGSIQVSVPTQTIQTQNMVSIAGSTGNIVFGDANNITFGENASTITASASFNQTNQNMSLYALGNTTQNSSTLLNASNLSFNGLGNVTVGYSNGSIQISGAGGGGGVAISNSNSLVSSGTAYLSAAGGALTISGTSQSFNFSVPQTSSLSATGAFSISTNGSTISMGAPQTSSISATGGVSISTNGSTISIGAPAAGTISNWEPVQLQHVSLGGSSIGASAPVSFFKLQPQAYVNASQLMQLISVTVGTTTNISFGVSFTVGAGIFTANGSTLSLLTQSSGTATYQFTNTSNNSTASLNGLRGLSLPMNISMSPGNYWLGMWTRSSLAGTNSFSHSNMFAFNNTGATSFSGLIGQASNVSQGVQEGVGLFATSSAALPSSAAMSAISQNGLKYGMTPYIVFKNQTW